MMEKKHKSGFVNIVGNPNVGKSTLMNRLVGERISIITSKAQTTRHRIMGIVNTDDMQIVYSDTPGVLRPNYKLQESMLNFSQSALGDADVLLYVTDVVETIDKNNEFLARVQSIECPVLLLINTNDQPNQPDMIKLNTNENPYPPAPGVEKALHGIQPDTLRLYPDPTAGDLVHAIARSYGLKDEQVFVGVGSDDVLAMSFLTFFNSDKPILFPDITYSFYDVWADLFRIPYECKALDENFCIRKEDYFGENGGIIFPNPNAPTGVELPLSDIEEILLHNRDVIVIVDEAYVDFGAKSALELIDKYDNLLVVQTFSKSRSMAGMRIGFACGNPQLIRFLNDVKYSFNSYTMDRITLATGVAAIQDKAYFTETCEKIIATREWAKKELAALGFTFPDSKTNFIFASHKSCPAKEIFETLRQEHIYVRYFPKPRIDNHLRITVGTQEEMEKLIHFLEKYLKNHK